MLGKRLLDFVFFAIQTLVFLYSESINTMPRLCVFGCAPTGAVLHVFPNPDKFPDRLRSWVNIVGEKLNNLSDYVIYQNKRMCDIHFMNRDRNRNNRLNALAVPSLCLHGQADRNITMELDQPSISNAAVNKDLQLLSHPSTSKAFETGKPAGNITVEQDPGSSSKAPINKNLHLSTEPSTSKALQIDNPAAYITTEIGPITMEHNYCSQSKPVAPKKAAKKTIPTLVLKELKTTRIQVRSLRRNIKKLRERATSFKAMLANAEKIDNSRAFQIN